MSVRAWTVAAISLGLVTATSVIGVVATTRGRNVDPPVERRVDQARGTRQVGAARFRGVHGRLRATFRRERPSKFDQLIQELTEQLGPLNDRHQPALISPPKTMEGTLSLFSDGTGVIATDGVVSPLTWQRTGPRRARVAAGGMHARGDRLTWSRLDLSIDDADQDGLFDRGRTVCTCEWNAVHGDIAGYAPADYDVALEPLDHGPLPTITPLGHWEQYEEFVPTDRVGVRLSGPLPGLRALAALRVTADGTPLPGRVAAVASAHGQAAHYTFTPDVPLPLGATLGVVADGVTDLGGHPVRIGTKAPRVVADPGPLTLNPGFEEKLAGWIVRGGVHTRDSYTPTRGARATATTFLPAEGAAHAHVDDGVLSGYLDVPPTASRLRLSVVLLADASTRREATGWVRVVTSKGERLTLDLHAVPPGRPAILQLDLVPYRGQRLYVEAEAYDAAMVTGRPGAELLVDALRIE